MAGIVYLVIQFYRLFCTLTSTEYKSIQASTDLLLGVFTIIFVIYGLFTPSFWYFISIIIVHLSTMYCAYTLLSEDDTNNSLVKRSMITRFVFNIIVVSIVLVKNCYSG